MSLEDAIVAGLVLAAVIAIGRELWLKLSARKSCGTGGCASSGCGTGSSEVKQAFEV